ncbi:hypothetical protein M404DRAFT_166805 [Pisolithus tinctorius Marx 270]|uniref:Kinase n=1 Tax=Pisolithus tinctorius Marx 270 TaxID=870435 RepID=A0A0C3JBL5_PISTI|nr:hypothetical protein M404DRAFT_166805 [Pisolithus tinctorius Marx 270]
MSTDAVSTSSPHAHITIQRSHTLPPTAPLSSQVGGHAGVQTTEDGSLLLKPALSRELAFYQLVRDGISSDIGGPTAAVSGLKPLLPWIPKFLGVLSIGNHLVDVSPETMATHGLPAVPPANGTTTTIVLENLTYGFHKPCILDVKLGTILYDEDAPPEKKERMIRTAANTTSLSTGVRLTGFQVYANDHPDPVLTPKKYGKMIKPEHLPDGIARFFPFRHPASSTTAPPSFPSSSDDITTPDNIQPGLPPLSLFVLLTRLLEALERLRAALAEAEVRIVGGSILIIYEGDWARAEKASFEENDDDDECEDEDENDDPRPFRLSLIDFAHTRLVPGQGPDTGVLLGIDTLIRLIRERRDVVQLLINEGVDAGSTRSHT